MARQFGTDSSIFNTLSAPLTDPSGIPIVDTTTGFGSSPLGISLREQIQFGLPNASFNLLPPDPASAIAEGENPLPFWELQTTPNITATATYDTTTQTWGVKIDPGTAPSGDYATLKTRSWVTTDDNLALRQKASLTLAKNGTYAGTSQWNATLTSEYFDHTNTSLGTTTIGTVFDNTTWTSISGTTTAGGSAIPSSASWAEFTVKLTATAAVTSSTSVTLKSLLLATSSAGGGSFVVVDTFTASGTWTRPAGVTMLYSVIAVGAGGGGGGGGFALRASTGYEDSAQPGAGGGGAGWIQVKDIDITGVTSVSVGVGAGGVGGVAKSALKASGSSTSYTGTTYFNSNAGAAGGSTNFGTYVTVSGGIGGTAGISSIPAGTASAPSYVDTRILTGGTGGVFTNSTGAITAGGTSQAAPYTLLYTISNAGASGGNFTYTNNGTAQAVGAWGTGAVGGSAGVGGGGGCGSGKALPTPTAGGNDGGGGGGAMLAITPSNAYSGREVSISGGTGGNGSNGVIYVVYVA